MIEPITVNHLWDKVFVPFKSHTLVVDPSLEALVNSWVERDFICVKTTLPLLGSVDRIVTKAQGVDMGVHLLGENSKNLRVIHLNGNQFDFRLRNIELCSIRDWIEHNLSAKEIERLTSPWYRQSHDIHDAQNLIETTLSNLGCNQ